MHEIVKYFILTEIRYKTVNFRSRSDRGNLPRDLAHSRCMEQCMVADLSAGLGVIRRLTMDRMEMGPGSQKAKNTIGPDLRSFLGMRLSILNSNIDHQFPGHFWIITKQSKMMHSWLDVLRIDCRPHLECRDL